uniref:Uncharacterized protein n=1 Tax=Rhizophora mucronata TaxID=61149 RepID=A0A2P2IUV5_RHIMU
MSCVQTIHIDVSVNTYVPLCRLHVYSVNLSQKFFMRIVLDYRLFWRMKTTLNEIS